MDGLATFRRKTRLRELLALVFPVGFVLLLLLAVAAPLILMVLVIWQSLASG